MGAEFATRFAEGMKAVLGEGSALGETYPTVEFEVVDDSREGKCSLAEAVGLSDIIVTATPSRKPLILKEWVKPGTHFSCMGSDMPGKQEIDENIIASANVTVDDMGQCMAVGEIETAVGKGLLCSADIRAEIGEIIAGKKPGRISAEEITVYDSTGLGLQDIAAGALAFRRAEELGVGCEVEF